MNILLRRSTGFLNITQPLSSSRGSSEWERKKHALGGIQVRWEQAAKTHNLFKIQLDKKPEESMSVLFGSRKKNLIGFFFRWLCSVIFIFCSVFSIDYSFAGFASHSVIFRDYQSFTWLWVVRGLRGVHQSNHILVLRDFL